MNRFQNEIVMGGSDIDSESEDEYITGPEIYNQYMYNAMMYTSMAQMMPCVPMPYVPPFGYPVPCPLPYPPMINEFPVNHPMAAGTYYRKGGRKHRSRRNKTISRSRLEGDDVRYRTHPKQHLLQSHQYYTSSLESDNDDQCRDIRGKGVQACQSVSHKIAADKLKSVNTLGSSNPTQNEGQHRLLNRPTEPLSNTINGSHVTGKSGNAAACHKMPLDNPNGEEAVMTENACQQGEHTVKPTQTDVHIAACATMPLCHDGQVPDSMDRQLGHDPDNGISIKRPIVVPSLYSDTASQVTTLAASDGDQGQQPVVAITQEVNTVANNVPLSCNPPYMVATDTTADSSETENGGQQTKRVSQIVSTSFTPEKTHVSMETGNLMSSQSLQPYRNTAMQLEKSEQDGGAIIHPQSPARAHIWRSETCALKYLQSFHSLRKVWAEWETKYRPPPVSVHTDRGAGPQNLHTSIS